MSNTFFRIFRPYDTDDNLLSGDEDVSTRNIYGGWYDGSNVHSGSTNIVMESGTVRTFFGGSFGGTLDGNTSVTVNGGKVGWVRGGGTFGSGDQVTVSAEAAEGYVFDGNVKCLLM